MREATVGGTDIKGGSGEPPDRRPEAGSASVVVVSMLALRPEQRYCEHGWEDLSELELLALALGPGLKERRASRMALELMDAIPPAGLPRMSLAELGRAGVRRRRALALLAGLRLAERLAAPAWSPGLQVKCSGQVFEYFQARLGDLKQETFWNVLLDGKNRLLELRQVSRGSLTSSLVHPREVFRPALLVAAAGSIFVHNHPSGDPEPSGEDVEISRRLKECGQLLGIRVLDHVVIGADRYFSFADQGLL